VITLIVLHLAAVIALGILNSKIRKMPEEFQEAKYIALLFTAILQLYLLAIPVFIAAFASPSARFMVLSTFVFFTCFFFLFFVFVPKMEQVRRNLLFRNWQLQQDSKDELKRSTSGLEVDFVEGVRNNYVREKFLKFAECNLVIESYFFYMDVECFKANPIAADTGKLDVQKARDIYNCYIREGGLLQINVSASTREQVTRAYQSFAATKKTGDAVKEAMAQINSNMSDDLRKEFTMIFDPAQEEIVSLLNLGAWRAFVNEGGMYRPSGFARPNHGSSSSTTSPFVTPMKSSEFRNEVPAAGASPQQEGLAQVNQTNTVKAGVIFDENEPTNQGTLVNV
jgi:hypothetical protein